VDRRIAECLHDILALKVGIIGPDVVDALPIADLPGNHANGNAHPLNARLAPHDIWLPGYAIYLAHAVLLVERVGAVSHRRSS
jgi:hypothetical protein